MKVFTGYTILVAAACVALSGCAEYSKMAESVNGSLSNSYTSLVNGKQEMEIAPGVPKDLKLNLVYRVGDGKAFGAGNGIINGILNGDFTYSKSCNTRLTFTVVLYNQDKALMSSEMVYVGDYQAHDKALIDQNVSLKNNGAASSKVGRLLVKNFSCS